MELNVCDRPGNHLDGALKWVARWLAFAPHEPQFACRWCTPNEPPTSDSGASPQGRVQARAKRTTCSEMRAALPAAKVSPRAP